MQKQRPVTERANELTTELDVSSPKDFVHLLCLSDNQIFEGFEDFPSLLDISDKVAAAAEAISTAITTAAAADEAKKKKKKVRVVMAGAGTSGRIAWVVSKDVNATLVAKGIDPCCRYLIAGGDLALLTSQESAEDDVVRARGDLERLLKEDGEDSDIQLIYIGITCGLSAPYVASQLDMAMGIPNSVTILMGFNPVSLARTLPIEGWPGVTFSTVAQRLAARSASDPGRHHVLTPVYGPESVAGSTRMKGGSTTKLLLDALFTLALLRVQGTIAGRPLAAADARAFFEGCRAVLPAVEKSSAHCAVESCGAALRAGGHIYYYGNPLVGTLGVIDASECVPTFGARPDDISAYVTGGWASLANRDGDLSARGGAYDLSGERFLRDIVPRLTEKDSVVIVACDISDALDLCRNVRRSLGEEEEEEEAAERVNKKHGPRVCAFAFPSAGDIPCAKVSEPWLSVVFVPEPEGRPLAYTNKQLAVKLVLNAISTGAFTAAGKVFRNRMVDLRISNAKLCLRAYDLVASLTGVPAETAQQCVMRAIYGEVSEEQITELLAHHPLSDHVKAAYQQEKVVPVALLLASGVKSVDDAKEALKAEPVVRTALLHAIKKK